MIFKSEDLHTDFLGQMTARVDFSMDKLSSQRARWDKNYKACTAYLIHEKNEYEKQTQQLELDKLYGNPRESNKTFYSALPVTLAVPYTFAVVHTVCTVLLSQFTSQRPYFPIVPLDFSNSSGLRSARLLEEIIQYQLDSTNYVAEFHKATQAACITGCGPLLCSWEIIKKNKYFPQQSIDLSGNPTITKQRREVITYSGNKVTSIDPFYFVPDPRVPMHKAYADAEFIFWVDYGPRFKFMQDPQYEDVELVKPFDVTSLNVTVSGNDNFDLQWTATNVTADQYLTSGQAKFEGGEFLQLVEGTIYLRNGDVEKFLTKEYRDGWGVDGDLDPDKYQKYLVSMLNGNRVIQVRPFDYNHDNHPVVVLEPLVLGTTFGSMSFVDLVIDFEKIMSWLFNSRVANVQQIINSKVFYDFTSINPEDMANPKAVYVPIQGSVYGGAVGDKVSNFVRPDVTTANFAAISQIISLVELIVGVSPMITGQGMPSGRRSASESRISAQSSTNRIGTYGKLLSSLGTTHLGNMFVDNIQQYMSESLSLSGGATVTPTDVLGNFKVPVYDNSAPIDTQNMIETWGELLTIALGDPQLRQSTDVVGMYSDLGVMAGFRNFDRRVQPMQALPVDPTMRGNGAPQNDAVPDVPPDQLGLSEGL